MKRKIISSVFLIFGTLAFLMLFVIPFILCEYFPQLSNDKTFAIIYFITFLTFTVIGNISGEKANLPLTKDEQRVKKIDQIIN